MPGASLDHRTHTFTVSQSFIADAQRCPERAHYVLDREPEPYNDATACGIALHTYMALRLTGHYRQESIDRAEGWLVAETETEGFRWVKVKTMDTLFRHLNACIVGMERHVIPQLPERGVVERKMRAGLCHHRGWTIVLEGTPDFVDPNTGWIWDWKSAGTMYDGWEAANWFVQPTSYTYLASKTFGRPFNDFTYAIAVKPHGDIQLIDVQRNEANWAWLSHVSKGLLNLALALGDEQWPVNHTHYLCSPDWCPHWDTCRGAVEAGLTVSIDRSERSTA